MYQCLFYVSLNVLSDIIERTFSGFNFIQTKVKCKVNHFNHLDNLTRRPDKWPTSNNLTDVMLKDWFKLETNVKCKKRYINKIELSKLLDQGCSDWKPVSLHFSLSQAWCVLWFNASSYLILEKALLLPRLSYVYYYQAVNLPVSLHSWELLQNMQMVKQFKQASAKIKNVCFNPSLGSKNSAITSSFLKNMSEWKIQVHCLFLHLKLQQNRYHC